MKKFLIILFILSLCVTFAEAQRPKVDEITAREKITTPMIKSGVDTVVKGGGIMADSIRLSGQWYKTFGISGTLTNGYIPYTTGTNVMSNSPLQTNGTLVGIGIVPATYTLNVNGTVNAVNEISGSNAETNIVSLSSRFGREAGLYEDKTAQRYNVFVGTQSGRLTSTGASNTFIGYSAGYKNTTGGYNVVIGSLAGYSNVTGSFNAILGYYTGYSNVKNSNTFLGSICGYSNKYGSGNIYIGYGARKYGVNYSNELVIDNQPRGTSANDSSLVESTAIIYGKFNSSYTAQSFRVNAKAVVNGTFNFGADIGTTDDYAVTITGISAYQTGMIAYVKVTTANTGACTLNINSLGAKSLKIKTNQDPSDNYIKAGTIIHVIYDGTNFQMLQPAAN